MERYSVNINNDPNKESKVKKIIADEIVPLVIKNISDSKYSILFVLHQLSNDEVEYVQLYIHTNNLAESNFLNSSVINYQYIIHHKDRLKMYSDLISGMEKGPVYASDMLIKPSDNSYHVFNAYKQSVDTNYTLNVYLPRNTYIKLNLYLLSLYRCDLSIDNIFGDKRLNNVEFATIERVNLDATSYNPKSNDKVTMSHYTFGIGPTEYKANFVSPIFEDSKLRVPLITDMYMATYKDDFIINDMFYDPVEDNLYIIYIETSNITRNYKSTKILKLGKDMYSKTNFIDYKRIYKVEDK